MQLRDRVALVTGAGSGIGRAAAIRLAREGARIGALGKTEQKLKNVCDEIRSLGAEAIPLPSDISDPDRIRESIDTMINEWGRLDIVFANAGINGVWAPLEALKPEEWDLTLNVNLKGTFLTIKYAVPHLKEQGGSVIITSSINGTRLFSNTGATAYSSSKAGQVAFAKMIALELARWKVRVNVICPGAIETNIEQNMETRDIRQIRVPVKFPEGSIPLTGGEPGSAEQVAELVLFLASDASSHITGTEIWIDGGESLLQG